MSNTKKKSKQKQHQGVPSSVDISLEDSTFGSQFSPVKALTGTSPAQGNLTGSARKVKDTAADWFNYLQKWKKLNKKGFLIVTQISNSKLSTLFGNDDEGSEAENMQMPEEMHSLVTELEEVCSAMETIIQKFEKMTNTLKQVSDLEWHQNNKSWSSECLFQTWPTLQFYTTSKEMTEMYVKEASLKKTIMENIAHATDRHLLMFYTSAWLHQPYIHQKCELLIDSMLQETGHHRS